MWRTVSCAITKLVLKLAKQRDEAISAKPSVSKIVRMFQSMLHHLLSCADHAHAEVGTASDLPSVSRHSYTRPCLQPAIWQQSRPSILIWMQEVAC